MDQLKRINIALSDIIEETFDIAHLKDARTGKYIQSSPGFVQWRGQQPEIFKNFDQKVQSTKCRARQETLLFSPEGNILVQETIKTPIFDHNHKTVIAIYTHSRDFTFQRSLPELLSLYTEFYPQEQAIQHLLMHLEIDGYFNALPTPEEMNILFSIHQTPHMDEA